MCMPSTLTFMNQERERSDLQKAKDSAYHGIYEESKWLENISELYAERALWGNTQLAMFTRWKLDQVEGYYAFAIANYCTIPLTPL